MASVLDSYTPKEYYRHKELKASDEYIARYILRVDRSLLNQWKKRNKIVAPSIKFDLKPETYYHLKYKDKLSDIKIANMFMVSLATLQRWKNRYGIKAGQWLNSSRRASKEVVR